MPIIPGHKSLKYHACGGHQAFCMLPRFYAQDKKSVACIRLMYAYWDVLRHRRSVYLYMSDKAISQYTVLFFLGV